MNCPICTKRMPPKTVIMCPACWWALPGSDRAALGALHRAKNISGVKAKVAAIVKRAKKVTDVVAFVERATGGKLQPYQKQIVAHLAEKGGAL